MAELTPAEFSLESLQRALKTLKGDCDYGPPGPTRRRPGSTFICMVPGRRLDANRLAAGGTVSLPPRRRPSSVADRLYLVVVPFLLLVILVTVILTR